MTTSKKPIFNGWMWTVLIVTALVCGVFVFANLHPYTLRFEMDDNTLEAFKSINWSALDKGEPKYPYPSCYNWCAGQNTSGNAGNPEYLESLCDVNCRGK